MTEYRNSTLNTPAPHCTEEYSVVVAGTGPAGIAAAYFAAQSGARVLLLERLDKPGVKLLASGGGRCNFSNTLPENEFMMSFGRNGRFMTQALKFFGRDQLLEFLKKHGVPHTVTDGKYYFPASGRAADVRDAFLENAKKMGVRLRMNARVTQILTDENGVTGAVLESGETIPCKAVILAAGGNAFSPLGGSACGLELAKSAGHTIVKPLPAMAPLVSNGLNFAGLAGVSLTDAKLSLVAEKKRLTTRGELVFTHDGLSGPAALNLSAPAYREFDKAGSLPFTFAPVAELSEPAAWQKLLTDLRTKDPKKLFRTSLARYMPHSLANELCALAGAENVLNMALNNQLVEKLAKLLSGVPLTIAKLCPMAKAMSMSGGVALKEVDPATMQSKLVPGLFFAGEILDLAGPCGGYHIQFAFSSGALAGNAAAR